MIIDDEPAICEVVARFLGSEYETTCVYSAEAALPMISEKRPNLILCDARMPRMDGYEFMERVRKDPVGQSIPVIIMTAWGDGTCETRALTLGANGFLPKPFLASELREFVASRMPE